MDTAIIPLGTAGAIPTRGRHLSSFAVERKGRVLLFDCGEGAQYRLLHGELNRARVDAVFITHLHGDHVYGLPGLAATIGQLHRSEPLTVVGPVGLQRLLAATAGTEENEVPYGLNVVELDLPSGDSSADPPGGASEAALERVTEDAAALVYETDELTVTARPLDHRVPTAGYRLEEKPRRGRFDPDRARELGVTDPREFGRLHEGESVETGDGTVVRPEQVVGPEREGIAFAYCTDTRPCPGSHRLAEGADLVVHDATFLHEMLDHARETGHATAREAAEVARDAGARRLLLTHFSARYETPAPLVDEARTVFPASDAAEELRQYTLDPREKWGDNAK